MEITPRAYSRIAGIGYLMIIIAGIFAEFFLRSNLIVPGDAAATANNIIGSESSFRLSIAGDLIMLTFDAVVALALYVLLKPVNKGMALLATFFRLVHTAIYGANLLNLFIVLLVLSGAGVLAAFGAGQTHALVSVFLSAHGIGYAVGLVFFGLHCLLIGYLIFRSGYFPRILGGLMVAAGFGYLIDSFAHVLLTNYAAYESILTVVVFAPALVAELALALWLLLKGVKVQSASI